MAESLMQKKTLCMIIGASKGFGKSIAEKVAAKFPAGSTILLLARSVDKLEDLANTLRSSYPNIKVVYSHFDQSDLNQCSRDTLENILMEAVIKVRDFDQAMIVHNAAVLGDISKQVTEITDKDAVQNMWNVNVIGTILINGTFWSVFTNHVAESRVVINITSSAGLLPCPSMSMYCAAKAARDMFFLTLAKEDPVMRVLTFDPGNMNTDLAAETMLNTINVDVRKTLSDLQESGQLRECDEVADKLVTLLESNTFESGKYIEITNIQ